MPEIATSEELKLTVSRLDVDDPESVAACFAEAKAGGPVDVLINNAGIFQLGSTEDLPIDLFERTINTNYLGAMRLHPSGAAGRCVTVAAGRSSTSRRSRGGWRRR